MNLFRVTCRCGWTCYRLGGAVQGRKCPQCRETSLSAAVVAPDEEVVVTEPNGTASAWSPEQKRWIAQ